MSILHVRLSPDSTPGQGGVPPPAQRPMIRPIGSAGAPSSAPPAATLPPVTQAANGGSVSPDAPTKIRAFGQGLAGGHHTQEWKRPTNLTGKGATHMKSFHCKLTGDSLENLDKQINEWLDSHPDYEVKLVTTTVGDWTGKLREPNVILTVWV